MHVVKEISRERSEVGTIPIDISKNQGSHQGLRKQKDYLEFSKNFCVHLHLPEPGVYPLYMSSELHGALALPAQPGAIKPASNKFPKGPIGPKFVEKFMPWFETYWHTNKHYPSVTDIITRFGFTMEQVEVLHNSKFWLLSLDRRGIARPNSVAGKLSDRQVTAVAIWSNFSDPRPVMARLADAGITSEELEGWMSNPDFKAYFQSRAQDTFENASPVATVQLSRLIAKGNFQAIKFYYEITGQANSPEALNVRQAMNILIEAVQKHVKDPVVLQAIAQEVQAIRGLGQ